MPALKTGALTRAEIQSVWEGSVDKGYRDPLIDAGEGEGFEAWTQLFAQFERASRAIDVTTQAMFISPWSGQSNPPAAGGQKATVTLTIQRTKRVDEPLLLAKGLFVVEEETTDFGPSAGVTVRTGRRYILTQDLYFPPGVQGPFTVSAEAERFGYGYNNPLPGTLKAIEQLGSVFENDRATVEVTTRPADLAGASSKLRLVTWNEPDMFVPEHLGQYIILTAGTNAGKVARLTAFEAPIPPSVGSAMELEMLYCVGLNSLVGTLAPGDVLTITGGSTSYGRVVDARQVNGRWRVAFVLINGPASNVAVSSTLTCGAATGTVFSVDFTSSLVAEAPIAGIGGAAWRILDWTLDWGLTVTNVLSPSGGRAAFLDELGAERRINRAPGEPDELYRARVREVADVVTPNAVKRALNRALPGMGWCLREVGQVGLPGFYFDGTGEPADPVPHGARNDAYDVDTIAFTGVVSSGAFLFQEPVILEETGTFALFVQGWMGRIDGGTVMTVIRKTGTAPSSMAGLRIRGLHSGAIFTPASATPNPYAQARRYRIWLDYEQFRAFFLVTMSPLGLGEFGFAYDEGDHNAYDVEAPYQVAYDGFPYLAANIYSRVYNAIENVRAGGVGWELKLDGGSCP